MSDKPIHSEVSQYSGIPKSSMFMGFSIIKHLSTIHLSFWGISSNLGYQPIVSFINVSWDFHDKHVQTIQLWGYLHLWTPSFLGCRLRRLVPGARRQICPTSRPKEAYSWIPWRFRSPKKNKWNFGETNCHGKLAFNFTGKIETFRDLQQA